MIEDKFIESIKLDDEYVCAYLVQEEVKVLWLIITEQSYGYSTTTKYLRKAREISNGEITLIIFEDSQLEEVKEQLLYSDLIKEY